MDNVAWTSQQTTINSVLFFIIWPFLLHPFILPPTTPFVHTFEHMRCELFMVSNPSILFLLCPLALITHVKLVDKDDLVKSSTRSNIRVFFRFPVVNDENHICLQFILSTMVITLHSFAEECHTCQYNPLIYNKKSKRKGKNLAFTPHPKNVSNLFWFFPFVLYRFKLIILEEWRFTLSQIVYSLHQMVSVFLLCAELVVEV
jgi:hypothetical protein